VLDDTAADTTSAYVLVNGNAFITGCSVLFNTQAATSVTYVNQNQLRVVANNFSAGTYIVYVVNPDGGTALRVNGLTFSASPVWTTASALPNQTTNSAVSIQLTATGATSYSVAAGSSLPSGLSLNTQTGLISGTAPNVASTTNYSFTIIATDNELQDSPRTFTLSVITQPASFTISPAVSGKSTWDLNSDGPLNLITAGTWTITPQTASFAANVKVWGAAGGAGFNGGTGGGGGYAFGRISFQTSTSYLLVVGAGGNKATSGAGATGGTGVGTGGTGGGVNGGGGGGGGAGSGVFFSTTMNQANAILVGGGGSGAAGIGYNGGPGGGTTGFGGEGWQGGGCWSGGGGTQSAAGSGSSCNYGDEGAVGSAGSGMNGGNGGNGVNSSNRYGGGSGGGGYWGGGGGTGGGGGSGAGGGGSGFISANTARVTLTSMTAGGLGGLPGNDTDPNRDTNAGKGITSAAGSPGQIYITSA
jgi:hypothetical protein